MGLLKNLKTWCSCQINGKSKEYEDYKFELNSKNQILSDLKNIWKMQQKDFLL